MYYTGLLVEILQRFGDLGDDVAREILAKVGEANNLVEKLATRAKLEDNVVVLPCLLELDELDNVGVVDLAHDLHLFENVGTLLGARLTSAFVTRLHKTRRCGAFFFFREKERRE